MTQAQQKARRELVIPPPRGDRTPLKVNAFQQMRIANTALCPMFPYLGEGCFAPVVAIFRGGDGRELSMFKHFNTQDEVLTVLGASGMRFKLGVTLADVRTHVVNIGFVNPKDPDSYACLAVVQRQSDDSKSQREAVTFLCEKCNAPLMEHAFDSCPVPKDVEEGFHTLVGAARAAEQFNADEKKRTCAGCGHVSAPFPVRNWGWERYATQCDTVENALRAYPGAHGDGQEKAHA